MMASKTVNYCCSEYNFTRPEGNDGYGENILSKAPKSIFCPNLYHIYIYVQVQGTIWTELDDSRLYKQVKIEVNMFPVKISKFMVTPQQLGETIQMSISFQS